MALMSIRARWMTTLVVIGAVQSSCKSHAAAGVDVAVVDSAGIEIVDFDLDQLAEYGFLEGEPDWVFGESPEDPGGVALNDVTDAVLMSDGRVAVVNWTPLELYIADPGGGRWEKLTQEGHAPGEVQFVRYLAEQDGIIGVNDSSLRRWLTYEGGEFTGSWELPKIGTPGIYFPEVVIPDGDGLYVADAFIPPGSQGGIPVRRLVLVARVVGDEVDTITVIPGDTGIDKVTGVSPLPWGASYGIARGDSGLWLGDSDYREVRFWRKDGLLERIVRWRSAEDRSLTRRRINAYRDRAMEGRPKEVRASIRQNFRDMELPEEVPAWGRMLRSVGDLVWISDYPGPGPTSPFRDPYPAMRWWGIDVSGRPVGTLSVPSGLEVTGFGNGFVIGIHKDSLGVETVRRYHIRTPTDADSERGPDGR